MTVAECRQLPSPLLLQLVRDTHATLATDFPAPVVQFLMLPLLSKRSAVGFIYFARPSWSRANGSDQQKAFAKYLDDDLMLPAMHALFVEHQTTLREMKEGSAEREWTYRAYGKSYCGDLLKYESEPIAPSAAKQLWSQMPAMIRSGWMTRVRDWAEQTHSVDLDSDLRFSQVLVSSGQRSDSGDVYAAIRSHPNWRAALQQFNYSAALSSLPNILQPLALTGQHRRIRAELERGLKTERNKLQWGGFNWRYLADMLDIDGSDVNPMKSADNSARASAAYKAIPISNTYRAIRSLAATSKSTRTNYYKEVAKLYAINRGLRK